MAERSRERLLNNWTFSDEKGLKSFFLVHGEGNTVMKWKKMSEKKKQIGGRGGLLYEVGENLRH